MFVPALRIALGKMGPLSDRSLFEQALSAAQALELVAAGFEERINANKAARGEKPTRLSKGQRAQIESYTSDAQALEREQLAIHEAELSPQEIVQALRTGLQSDLTFWSGAAKYAHADDRAIVEEFVAAKQRLLVNLDAILNASGDSAA